MKVNAVLKITTIIVSVLLIASALCGCGKKYTCEWCGKTVSEAYASPLEEGVYYCRNCAEQYFGPNVYSHYRVK